MKPIFIGLIICLIVSLTACWNETGFQSPFDWRPYPYLEITYASGISAAHSSSTEYSFWIGIVIVNESNHSAYNIEHFLMMHDKTNSQVTLYRYTKIESPPDSLDERESIGCYWEGYTWDALAYSFDIILFFENDEGNTYVSSLLNEPFRVYDYR